MNIREVLHKHPVSMNMFVWTGFIALLGLTANDGLTILSRLEQAFQKEQPQDVRSIRNVVLKMKGKIVHSSLLTTTIILFSLFPLLTSSNRGSEIILFIALPIFGGTLIKGISIFIIPVLYAWKEEWRLRSSRKKNQIDSRIHLIKNALFQENDDIENN